MIHDPWALPAGFYSIIVKRAAVARSFPDGIEEFERDYQPARKNGALYLLARMSMADTEFTVEQLMLAGLLPGEDLAVADMIHGPLLPCPGLTFASEGEFLDTRWWVNVDPRHIEPERQLEPQFTPKPPALAVQPTTPNADGWRPVVGGSRVWWCDGEEEEGDGEYRPADPVPIREDGAWVTIASRWASGALDGWEEFLCARCVDDGWMLDVCANEWLGEVPGDWTDEDGELLPQHQDDDSDLKLPDGWLGRPVVGHTDGGFIGDLRPVQDNAGVLIGEASEEAIRQALDELDWDAGAVVEVQEALQRLAGTGGARHA